MSDSDIYFSFGYIINEYPKDLHFYEAFNSPITEDMIEIIKNSGCRHLHLGKEFNQNLDNLPNGIESVILSECEYFNQSLDNLPVTLTYLVISEPFNRRLDFLPAGLKHLELPIGYNQSLDNLPNGLEYLKIDWFYDNPLNNLPRLKILKIFSDFYKYDLLILPSSLEKLIISSSYKGKIKEGVTVEYY